MLPLIILSLVCALTYSFEIVFGLGGTILMLPLLSIFYDAKTLVVYSAMPQILVATIGIVRSPKTVKFEFLAKMLFFATLGGFVGLYLFYYFSSEVFHVLLASTITVFGIYLVFVPGKLKFNSLSARLLDTLAGASQALFGISGPIAMTRLLGTFHEKIIVRNYALAFFLALNIFRVGGYVINGTVTAEVTEMMVFSAPFLVLSLWYSNQLHFKVNETLFRSVISWLIILGGLSLFYR